MTTFTSWETELYHFGIRGMKWGIRRYQNEDGTLTEAGKRRYGTAENFNRLQSLKKKPKYRTNEEIKALTERAKVETEYRKALADRSGRTDVINTVSEIAKNRLENRKVSAEIIKARSETRKSDNELKKKRIDARANGLIQQFRTLGMGLIKNRLKEQEENAKNGGNYRPGKDPSQMTLGELRRDIEFEKAEMQRNALIRKRSESGKKKDK